MPLYSDTIKHMLSDVLRDYEYDSKPCKFIIHDTGNAEFVVIIQCYREDVENISQAMLDWCNANHGSQEAYNRITEFIYTENHEVVM